MRPLLVPVFQLTCWKAKMEVMGRGDAGIKKKKDSREKRKRAFSQNQNRSVLSGMLFLEVWVPPNFSFSVFLRQDFHEYCTHRNIILRLIGVSLILDLNKMRLRDLKHKVR